MKNGIETKVTASSGAALLSVAALAVLNHWVPGFRPVAPYVAPAVAWLVTLGAGYFAPHTSRTPAAPVINVHGDPTKQPAVITFDQTLADMDIEKLKTALRAVIPLPAIKPPSVQPSATGTSTGAMTGTGTTPMTGGTP